MSDSARRLTVLALVAAAVIAAAAAVYFLLGDGRAPSRTGPGSIDQPGFPLSFTDDIGRKIIVKEPPARIVSLSPSITEVLFELGLGDRLVGVDPASDYPAGAEAIRKAGTAERPDYEAIALADPDVVLTDRRPSDDILLTRHAPLAVIRTQDPAGVRKAILTLGRVTDRDDIANTLVEGLLAGERAITDQAKAKKAKTAVVRVDYPGRPDLGRLHVIAMLESIGVTPTLEPPAGGTSGATTGGNAGATADAVTPEQVRSARPGLLIFMSPQTTRESFTADPEWRSILEPENGRGPELLTASDVDPELLLRPGPRYVQALQRLFEAAYPVGIGRPQ